MSSRSRIYTSAAALFTVLALACDESSPEGFAAEDVTFRGGSGQGGPVFNTSTIFTSEIAAVDTQGLDLAGVTLAGVERLDGGVYKPIDAGSLSVDHGTLVAQVNGIDFEGLDFVGSRWTFKVDGAELQAHLTTVETADDASLYAPLSTYDLRKLDPERLVYTFTWFDEEQQPHTTCEEDAVGGARTVIYGDIVVDHTLGEISERPDTVYFGCISGAVGKAALWGYAPDSPSLPSVPLAAFETATRVVRADYCADGNSYTAPGNPLTLRDRWLINEHAPLGFTTEAVWQEGGGALCLRRIRSTGATLLAPHLCPDNQMIPLCGADAQLEDRWANDYGDFWTKLPL